MFRGRNGFPGPIARFQGSRRHPSGPRPIQRIRTNSSRTVSGSAPFAPAVKLVSPVRPHLPLWVTIRPTPDVHLSSGRYSLKGEETVRGSVALTAGIRVVESMFPFGSTGTSSNRLDTVRRCICEIASARWRLCRRYDLLSFSRNAMDADAISNGCAAQRCSGRQ